MALIGQHFLDRNKEWGLAQGKTVSLVDVGYVYPSPGFSVQNALERLAQDCNILWDKGVFAQPYLRIDYAVNETLRVGDKEYNRAIMEAMQWWTGAPRASLTIIIGNEPNLGTPIFTEDCAQIVSEACSIRDLLGYAVRIFAPAVAPWAPTPADVVYPSPRGFSTPWEDWQYGLAWRLQGTSLDGYALHSYGRPLHIFDKDEPHRFTEFGNTGVSNGFRWFQDVLDVHAVVGDNRPLAITEVNTFTDRHSSESYPYGWLQEARAAIANTRIESLNWFVGEPHGEEWAQESTKLRIGQCAAADDDLNQELQR